MEGENLQELVKKQAETIKLLQVRIVELEAVIACLQKNPAIPPNRPLQIL
jgi:FtsZ-binding cell division protein ZapB